MYQACESTYPDWIEQTSATLELVIASGFFAKTLNTSALGRFVFQILRLALAVSERLGQLL